jgi:hypothetical protein
MLVSVSILCSNLNADKSRGFPSYQITTLEFRKLHTNLHFCRLNDLNKYIIYFHVLIRGIFQPYQVLVRHSFARCPSSFELHCLQNFTTGPFSVSYLVEITAYTSSLLRVFYFQRAQLELAKIRWLVKIR